MRWRYTGQLEKYSEQSEHRDCLTFTCIELKSYLEANKYWFCLLAMMIKMIIIQLLIPMLITFDLLVKIMSLYIDGRTWYDLAFRNYLQPCGHFNLKGITDNTIVSNKRSCQLSMQGNKKNEKQIERLTRSFCEEILNSYLFV